MFFMYSRVLQRLSLINKRAFPNSKNDEYLENDQTFSIEKLALDK